MTYGELIRFDAIESSVRLRDSVDPDVAKRLVRSYIVSADIAGRLNAIVFPHLRIDGTCDNKGLLITGGRGIGKSHLLSVIAAIAEEPVLAEELRHKEAAEAAAAVAGQFKVIRAVVEANVPDLRKHICHQLDAALAQWGVHYSFPNRRLGNDFRTRFAEMMAAFHDVFPNMGLLLAVEELLPYLKGRGRRGLRQDMAFLRELGEACTNLRFRFVAGLQEGLSKAGFPSHLVRRLLDCFIQVPMPRNSLRFVVQNRLVRKTPEQEAKVRAYLSRFLQLYENMEERLEEYVSMFPVHPDYLDVVGRVSCVDKTDVVGGLSGALGQLLNAPLPDNYPGLIAYDDYWTQICASPQLVAVPEIQAVIDGSQRLEIALNQSSIAAARRPVARRLILALSVHRLTTGGIYTAHGTTPQQLRDQLCPPGMPVDASPGAPADDTLAQVVTLFSDLHEAVQGKLLAVDPSTFECYLRLNRFKRFVKPELVLHWVNAIPFMLLMATGGAMLASRFFPLERSLFDLLVTVHKFSAAFWLLFLPLTILAKPGVHWSHLRAMLTWGKDDIVWAVQTLRSLHNKYAPMSPADRFNTGQKINACLVMTYFFGFGVTGLTMLLRNSILLPWYIHTGLFLVTLGSVSGHLFLALVNPSTRIALAGIFHGWAPLEYVLHHHALSAPECLRDHHAASRAQSLLRELAAARRELSLISVAIVLIVADVMFYQHWRLERIKQVFARSFAEAVQPGALSTKHRLGKTAEACTKCHSYTGEIPDNKCEQCHADIRNRRIAKVGFHGNTQGDCRTCHKEHPTSTNSVVPFTQAKFDHNLASFKLEGKHARIACDECHKKKRTPKSPGIYYIGLRHDSCQACHPDRHRGQFTASCDTCHSPNGWTGRQLKFAHNTDSTFKLTGKHSALECLKCHPPQTPRSSLATATFKGLSRECSVCHREPHQKQLAAACTSCHTTEGWTREHQLFEHNRHAKYALVAKHSEAACEKCHPPAKPNERLGFAKFRGLKTECDSCHREPHAGQFDRACITCHPSPTAWTGRELRFTHNTDSQFVLSGKHVSVDCAKCHKPPNTDARLGQARFKGLPTNCEDCHKVQHPQPYGSSCLSCHTLNGWPKAKPASDHILKQEIEGEPLGGRHLLAKCSECHSPTRIGTLSNVRRAKYQCKDCHQKDETHPDSPDMDCSRCHGISSWKREDLRFNHDTVTRFALNRDHINVACFKCHEDAKWKPVEPACESCHKNKRN